MRPFRRAAVAVPLLLSSLVLAGCGDTQAGDLCTQYNQATTRADEIKNFKPSTARVNELRHALTNFEASLDRLQAAADDGRLDTVISNLRAALEDLRAAVDNGKKALGTAQPLLEDSLTEVDKQWGLLKQKADAECSEG